MTKKSLHARRFAHLVAALALVAMPAKAWERDVHYDLTRWLAMQAGFSAARAEQIAQADQQCDDSTHEAAVESMAWTYILHDVGAARDVQKKHFMSSAKLPSAPQVRKVDPDNAAAQRAMRHATETTDASDALEELGETIHAFQDTWSHSGVPDVPNIDWTIHGFGAKATIDPRLGFGHPVTRGGWQRHDADLTYIVVPPPYPAQRPYLSIAQNHPQEVVVMARRVYEYLTVFLANNPTYRSSRGADWNVLQGHIDDFARRNTQAGKAAWISTHSSVVTQPMISSADHAIAAELTLEGHSAAPLTVIATDSPLPTCVPPDLVTQASSFIQKWFTEKAIDAAWEHVDWEALSGQFDEPGLNGNREATAIWCKRFMTMYVVDDHGTANARGHCDPRHPGYSDMPQTPTAADPPRPLITAGAISPSAFMRLGCDDVFAMVLTFDRLAHDAVILVWERRGESWRITRMTSVVE